MKQVRGFIERKSMLYKTKVEHGDYCMNHVLGCSHGCKYCYAYMLKKRYGMVKSYEEWTHPMLVSNTLEILEKEIPKMKKDIRCVELCFATDPFMYQLPDVCNASLQVVNLLNSSDIKTQILTKGILPVQLLDLSKKNEYGITVTSLNQSYCNDMEPGAAPVSDRIASLKALHDRGFYTWISMEPYPNPLMVNQNIMDILKEISFVDRIVFGKMNYYNFYKYDEAKAFYGEKAQQVIDFCTEKGIDYHIKKGTICNG